MSLAPAGTVDVHRHLSPAAAARLLGRWHAGGPAYTALADALRAAVLAGTLAPHTRLPSERDLAVALGELGRASRRERRYMTVVAVSINKTALTSLWSITLYRSVSVVCSRPG